MDINFSSIDHFSKKSFGRSDGPGFARPSRFHVSFVREPKVLTDGGIPSGFFDNSMSVNVKNVALPEIGLEEQQTAFLRKGISGRKKPSTLTITFFESNNLDIKNYFYSWINAIYTDKDDNMYMQRYLYDDVVGKFAVYHIGQDGQANNSKCDVFDDVYPTNLQNINYNIEQENSLVEIAVTFSYRFHTLRLI